MEEREGVGGREGRREGELAWVKELRESDPIYFVYLFSLLQVCSVFG